MTIRFSLGFGAVAALLLAFALDAQPKKEKTITYQGSVQSVNKGTSMIAIRTGTVVRNVMYSDTTKFMYGHTKDNKPGSLDQLKEGNYILCAGPVAQDHLMAKECVYRESK